MGIALRSLSRGYLPDKAFIIVSLAVTAIFLIGWRSGLAAATPQVCSPQEYICCTNIKHRHPHPELYFLHSAHWVSGTPKC